MDLPLPLAFAIERGIATVLRLDPHTASSVSTIEGSVIRVEVTEPELVFHLIVLDGEIDVDGSFDGEPDTTISGSAAALLSLRNGNDAMYTGAVKISGDMTTGEQLRNLINNVEIDVAEIIAPVTGDAIAHQLGRIGSQFSAWLGDTGSVLKTNTSEYLQEEAELLAPNSEVARFCSEVDECRELHDRIEARLAQLEKKIKPS